MKPSMPEIPEQVNSRKATNFNLLELLYAPMELYAETAAGKHIELILTIDPQVPVALRGDPLRLQQLVLNLLDNAIKFTQRGEIAIAVTAKSIEPSVVLLRIAVRDTGIGIPIDTQGGLFKPLVPVDESLAGKHVDASSGLAMCKQLIEYMQGEIGVISRPAQGSVFWFTIQLKRAPNAKRSMPSGSQSGPFSLTALKGMGALVVHHNETSQLMLDSLLTSWGMLVSTTSTALTALQWLHEAATHHPIRLVVIDTQLQDSGGLQLAATIRDQQWTTKPVVVLTAVPAQRPTPENMRAAGISACENKPVNPGKFYDTVITALRDASTASPQGITVNQAH